MNKITEIDNIWWVVENIYKPLVNYINSNIVIPSNYSFVGNELLLSKDIKGNGCINFEFNFSREHLESINNETPIKFLFFNKRYLKNYDNHILYNGSNFWIASTIIQLNENNCEILYSNKRELIKYGDFINESIFDDVLSRIKKHE